MRFLCAALIIGLLPAQILASDASLLGPQSTSATQGSDQSSLGGTAVGTPVQTYGAGQGLVGPASPQTLNSLQPTNSSNLQTTSADGTTQSVDQSTALQNAGGAGEIQVFTGGEAGSKVGSGGDEPASDSENQTLPLVIASVIALAAAAGAWRLSTQKT